jgi:ATP-binding cassette subfamily F protein 3
MSILRLEGVRREIGDLVILHPVTAALARGERVGIVGANGAGKTTLLEMAAGRLEPDGGSVHLARGTRVGLLTQEAHLDREFRGARSVRGLVRSGAADVERMEHELASLEARGAESVQSTAYAALRDRFEAAEGYQLDQRVEAALSGLGIPRSRWDGSPTGLSGGEQTRVALARQLTADPDLLLLDEPTNHLDIAALEWLEAVLSRRRGALLVASHDRTFLDNVVERIWELRDRRLATFRGAYSAYLLQREAADARARSLVDSQTKAMAREEDLVQRYRSQRKHVKMHEHERRLGQLRDGHSAAPRAANPLRLPGAGIDGARAGRSAELVVSLEAVTCGYRSVIETPSAGAEAPSVAAGPAALAVTPVARVDRLEARRGERIGLVGPNGAGKSTLLRTIAGQLPALDGFVRVGRNVVPGYLSQLRDRPLGGETVLDAMLAGAPVTAGVARSYLARFLFRGDDVDKPVRALSGGERSRLELALMGIGTVNLLLLDEPTNHLDIPAREALEAFLRESEATVILVSHDRRLLESVCERLWVVEPAGGHDRTALVVPFDGGYRDWRVAVADGWSASAEQARRAGRGPDGRAPRLRGPGDGPSGARRASPAGAASAGSARAARASGVAVAVAAPDLPRLSKDAYRREIERIERDLARLGERKLVLEAGLGDPAVQANFVELRRLGTELADIDGAIVLAEDAWLALEERAPR